MWLGVSPGLAHCLLSLGPWMIYCPTTTTKAGGFKIPLPYDSETCRAFLDKKCAELGVDCKPPRSTARLLDKLVENFIRSSCHRWPSRTAASPASLSASSSSSTAWSSATRT